MEGNVFSLLVILSLFCLVNCNRISNKTYIDIKGKACFRRMNGTHQIGCSSEQKGNVGILHYIVNDNDTNWLLSHAPNPPYIVLLNSLHFNLDFVRKLRNSGKVNGVVVIHVLQNETLTPFPTQGFSPDKSCPNDEYGLYNGNSDYGHCKNVTWNPVGQSMMFEDFDRFPIFTVINQTEVEIMVDCYEKFNKPLSDGTLREYPLCAVELKAAMSGAKDARTCYKRTQVPTNLNPDTYCDPLGDDNVIATMKGVSSNEEYANNSVIVAAARLDSFSMFENIYPSADNHVTGIVGLLAAAEALSKFKDNIRKNGTKDILFAFFQGEAFDYIGSSRAVYDIKKNVFPMATENNKETLHLVDFDHISHLVEVNQLGYRDDGNVWVHTDPVSQKDTNISQEVDKMIKTIQKIADDMKLGMGETSRSQPLPPASIQRFLREKNLPSVVFTDHQQSYTNIYYNSRFDIAKAIEANFSVNGSDVITEQAKNLTRISTMLARMLYNLSTGEDAPSNMTSSEKLVNEMLYCFLVTRQCDLFRTVIDPADYDKLDESALPYPFYVSVSQTSNQITSLTKRLLSWLIGDRVNNTKDNCKQPDNNKVYQYIWVTGELNKTTSKRNPYCVKSTALFTTAESPLFDQDDYNWNYNEYSAWTESSWQTDSVSMRIFLVPSKHLETVTLSLGVILTLVFMTMTYFINSRASLLFVQHHRTRL